MTDITPGFPRMEAHRLLFISRKGNLICTYGLDFYTKYVVMTEVLNSAKINSIKFIKTIIIYLQKILDSGWSRVVQFRCNTSAESCNTSAEMCNTSANYNLIQKTKCALKLNVFGIFYYLENNCNFLNVSICKKCEILQKYSRNLQKTERDLVEKFSIFALSAR